MILLLLCWNIPIRVFSANLIKSGCSVQKYWSVTAKHYPFMCSWLFGSDQTKPDCTRLHSENTGKSCVPWITKNGTKYKVLYQQKQISYFTMQKNCYFQILSEMSQGCSLHVCLGHFSLIENILKPAVLPDQVYDMWIVKLWKWNGIFVSTIIKSSTIHLCH